MYELLYIIPAKFTEKEMELIIEKTNELIKKHDGEIISTENLNKKKLAYPIKQSVRGCYVFNCFNLDPQKIRELNKDLKIEPDILRFLITKFIEDKESLKKKKKTKKQDQKKKISSEDLDKKLEKILEN
ncbi:MAG: small subunit ribosomal protein S6 [Parcubacteria group bacterium Athens1014_10]|nr:MAG: small subunit ribosomal protein S6 [Parcubacteria group bacterium Athens1014_10]TSD05871.1 MAG: small subunit ribosomal protein S6 [Parcubacteria group bacterium Athens0714_12]